MPELDAFERDLATALRAFAERGVGSLDPATFADRVSARPRSRFGWPPIEWAPPHHLKLRWVTTPVGAAWMLLVAALVLALVAGLLLTGGRHGQAGWERLDLPGGGSIEDIAAGPAGWVAVGRDRDGVPAAWTSADCRHWTASAFDRPGSAQVWVRAVSRGGPGFVAIGQADVTTGTQTTSLALAWTSADGRTWQLAPGEPFRRGEAVVFVRDLAEANGLLVAIGDAGPDGAGTIAAVWTSMDGAGWRRVDPLDGAVRGYFHGMSQVVAGARGFVAVGEADYGVPIWTSPDGLSWSRIQAWSATAAGAMSPATSAAFHRLGTIAQDARGRLLALGMTTPAGYRAAAISLDGVAWSPVAVRGLDAPWSVQGMVATAGGYLAIGADWLTSPDGISTPRRGALWTSADGLTWTRVPGDPIPETVGLDRVLRCGDDLIVAGTTVAPAETWPPVLDPSASGFGDNVLTQTTWMLRGGATTPGQP